MIIPEAVTDVLVNLIYGTPSTRNTDPPSTVLRSKKVKHPRRHRAPTPNQIAIWQSTQAKWRQNWNGLFAHLWKNLFPPYDQTWWTTQAYLVSVLNYKNKQKYMTGFQFFMWYQNRFLDLFPERFIPFPANSADFPEEYAPPWTAP